MLKSMLCTIVLVLVVRGGASGSPQGAILQQAREKRIFAGSLGRCQMKASAYSPDGRLVVGGTMNGLVYVWDRASGAELRQLRVTSFDWVHTLAFSPDGTRLGVGLWDGSITVWDVASWQVVRSIRGFRLHDAFWPAISFSPDFAAVAVAYSDKQTKHVAVAVWDLETGKRVKKFTARDVDSFSFFLLGPGGRELITGEYYGPVRCWDVRTGKTKYFYPSSAIWVAFAGGPDRYLLALRDGRFALLRFADGAVVRTFPDTFEGRERIYLIAVSADGKSLAAASKSWNVITWNLESYGPGEVVGRTDGSITQLAFSPDGGSLAYPSGDGCTLVEVPTRK
jgi:WD40 repeat protein